MSTELQTQPQNKSPLEQKQAALKTFLERSQGSIAESMPKRKAEDAGKLVKSILLFVSRTPALLDCTKESILRSLMEAAQLGLDPGGPLGHAYMVPFNNKVKTQDSRGNFKEEWRKECTMLIGYRGYVHLARKSGEIASIESRVVYKGDIFRLKYGVHQVLEHEPVFEGADQEILGVYAIARFRDGATQFEYMPKWQVDRIRDKSKNKGSVWDDHYSEMARKTAVRRLIKSLDLSTDDPLSQAIQVDDEMERIAAESAAAHETAPHVKEILKAQKGRAQLVAKGEVLDMPVVSGDVVSDGEDTQAQEQTDSGSAPHPLFVRLSAAKSVKETEALNDDAQATFTGEDLYAWNRAYIERGDALKAKK